MKICHWFLLVLGLWILISPWALGFSSFNTAMWSNVASGLLISVCALWGLFGCKSCSQCGKPSETPTAPSA
ncbi:SPW repeat protein [Candidatus Wolfebacteria bacterium]|nr:SPW repeat protein [Candidatus Wolfebacteria bacterium]